MVKLSKISAAQKLAMRKSKHSMEISNKRVETMEDLMTFTESNETRGGQGTSSKQAEPR